MTKLLREGISYNHREVVDMLADFSAFKDRVEKRFRDLANELAGKPNEHVLWVNLYLVSCDYAEDVSAKNRKSQAQETPTP